MDEEERPTIVIVQGAVQPVEAYAPLHRALESYGYSVVHPVYPTLYEPDESERATKSLYDDAASVRSVLTQLIENEGRNVLIVCHSYGGLVASESVPEELTRTWRQTRGLAKGGVVHVFFICAAVLSKGKSIVSGLGSHQITGFATSSDDQLFTLRNSEEVIYNDLSSSEATHWDSLHRWQSMKSRSSPATREPYRHTETTYLVTEYDAIAPADKQEVFAALAGAQIKRIQAGHSPWLSRTAEVAKMIDGIAWRAVGAGA